MILQDNVIDTINNIEWCRELWNIDLSGNRAVDRWIDGWMDEWMDGETDDKHNLTDK